MALGSWLEEPHGTPCWPLMFVRLSRLRHSGKRGYPHGLPPVLITASCDLTWHYAMPDAMMVCGISQNCPRCLWKQQPGSHVALSQSQQSSDDLGVL